MYNSIQWKIQLVRDYQYSLWPSKNNKNKLKACLKSIPIHIDLELLGIFNQPRSDVEISSIMNHCDTISIQIKHFSSIIQEATTLTVLNFITAHCNWQHGFIAISMNEPKSVANCCYCNRQILIAGNMWPLKILQHQIFSNSTTIKI